MLTTHSLKPLQRQALVAALLSPTHSFQRTRAGFIPAGIDGTHRSAVQHLPTFTLRLMRMLDRDYLAEFDDPAFPSRATLTKPGLQLAQELGEAQSQKAMA
jgi:hypothetical protein